MDNYLTILNASKGRIKESQAVLYARDILLGCSSEKSEDKNHSLFCTNGLFSSNLATVSPSPSDAEPLKIYVRHINTGNRKNSQGNLGLQNVMSSDTLFSSQTEKSEAQSLDLSSCADESFQEPIHSSINVEVTVKISNIYRISSTKRSWNSEGETWG